MSRIGSPELDSDEDQFVTAGDLSAALAAAARDLDVQHLDPIREEDEESQISDLSDFGIFGNLDGHSDIEMPANNPPLAEIVKYSGHPQGTSYQSGDRRLKEMFEAQGWVDNFTLIKVGSAWGDAAAANTALLSLEPGSPAEQWAKVMQETNPTILSKWSTMAPALVKFFGRTITNADRANTLRTLKQGAQERTKDYHNRVYLSFKIFRQGLTALIESDEDKFGAAGSVI